MYGFWVTVSAVSANIAGVFIARSDRLNQFFLLLSGVLFAMSAMIFLRRTKIQLAFRVFLLSIFFYSFYRSLPEWTSDSVRHESFRDLKLCGSQHSGFGVIEDLSNSVRWKVPCHLQHQSSDPEPLADVHSIKKSGSSGHQSHRLVNSLGSDLRSRIESESDRYERRLREWLRLFILGNQSFDSHLTDVIRGTRYLGLFHILIISGLHIHILGVLILGISLLPIRVVYGFRLTGPSFFVSWQCATRLLCCFGMVLYMNCTGFGAPVQRAGTFFILMQCVRSFFSYPGLLVVSSATAVFQVLFWPLSFFQSGTFISWLSWFMVVFVLHHDGGRRRILRLQLGFMLMTAACFGQISLLSWIFNLMIVPLMPFILVCSWVLIFQDVIWVDCVFWSKMLLLSFLDVLGWLGGDEVVRSYLYYDISELYFIRGACGVGLGMFLLSLFPNKTMTGPGKTV